MTSIQENTNGKKNLVLSSILKNTGYFFFQTRIQDGKIIYFLFFFIGYKVANGGTVFPFFHSNK